MKGIMQEIGHESTTQGVLKVPQKHNIIVQSVCHSLLKMTSCIANKPKHLLTEDYCHLPINLRPVNNLIKNITSPMITI